MRWFWPSTRQLVKAVLTNTEKIMDGVADLKQAVADVATNVAGETTAINDEIAIVEAVVAKLQAGGLTDAEAEALAQQLQGTVTNIKASTGTLTAETTKLQAI